MNILRGAVLSSFQPSPPNPLLRPFSLSLSHSSPLLVSLQNFPKFVKSLSNTAMPPSSSSSSSAFSSFPPGTKVEARFNEVSFQGAWFEATVVKYARTKRRYTVALDSLVTEDNPPKPVKETVFYTYVRPRPPGGGRSLFKLHQLVEAYHHDAWWKGVVTEVPRGADGPCTVRFPLSNEEFEFEGKAMREQLEWVKGKWIPVQDDDDQKKGDKAPVSSEKKQASHKMKIHAVERSKCPLSVLIYDGDDEVAGDCDAVNLEANKSEGHRVGDKVETSQPCRKSKNVLCSSSSRNDDEVGDKSGLKNLKNKKAREPHVEDVANSSQLRKKSKKGIQQEDLQILDGTVKDHAPKTGKIVEKFSSIAMPMPEGSPALVNKQNTSIIYPREKAGVKPYMLSSVAHLENCDGPQNTRMRRKRVVSRGPYKERKNSDVIDIKQLIQKETMENRRFNGSENIVEMANTSINLSSQKDNVHDQNKFTSNVLLSENARADYYQAVSEMHKVPRDSTPSRSSSFKRDICYDNEMVGALLDPSPTEDVRDLSKFILSTLPSEEAPTDPTPSTTEMVVSEVHKTPSDPAPSGSSPPGKHVRYPSSKDNVVDDQNNFIPSLLLSEEPPPDPTPSITQKVFSDANKIPGVAAFTGLSPSEEHVIDHNELVPSTYSTEKALTETDMVPTGLLSNKMTLPFTKGSAVWKMVESMEVFSTMPQKPHFHELNNCNMEVREGMALGYMLTFANLVDGITKLQITDSQEVIERKLEALASLESNGFNVRGVRSLLEKLLVVKCNASQVAAKQVLMEGQIKEKENEIHQLDLSIAQQNKVRSELEISLRRCQEKILGMLTEKNTKDSEVSQLNWI